MELVVGLFRSVAFVDLLLIVVCRLLPETNLGGPPPKTFLGLSLLVPSSLGFIILFLRIGAGRINFG